jgi:glutathione peroxidase
MSVFKKAVSAATMVLPLMGFTVCTLAVEPPAVKSPLELTVTNIDGKPVDLASYKGQVVMIVNVASRCGNTPQYDGLEALYNKYKDKGLVILGFPANNFLGQEPGTNEEIKTFCSTKYNVTFPMFSKISVKGDDIAPLYAWLTSPKTDPGFSGDIEWNFAKFLVDRDGNVVARFTPRTKPDNAELVKAVDDALAKPKAAAAK